MGDRDDAAPRGAWSEADGSDAAVDLVGTDPGDLTDGELASATVALARLAQRVEAGLCRHAAALEDRAVHRRDGAVSAPSWLTARTQMSRGRCGGVFVTARALRDCGVTAEAYRSGRLGTAVVQAMMRVREGLEGRFAQDEQVLVDVVAPLTAAAAQRALARWRELALSHLDASPEDPKPDDPTLNSLGIKATFDGNHVLDGTFAPVVGSELAGLIEAEVTRLWQSGMFSVGDGLTARQRNARALLELVRRGSVVSTEAGEPKRAATVLVDLRWLLGIRASTADELVAWPCQLSDGTVVPFSQVLDVLGDATINMVLGMFDLDGGHFRPVGEVTTNRHATASQRRLLRVRDQGCAWPGCDRPARWTQAHHEPPWEDVHETTVAKMVLLCQAHHTMRHRDGYRFILDTDGTLVVRRPDGTHLPDAAPGHVIPTPAAPRGSPGRAA